MDRSLIPDRSPNYEVEWDVVNRTLTAGVTFNPNALFSHTMPFLKFSGDLAQNQLWVFDTREPDDPAVVPNPDTTKGAIYRFIDNICKSGPYIDILGEIGCDPVTGRNQEVNFKWEQLSISNVHELHLDKSKKMDLPVFSAFAIPYDITSPTLIYLSGGEGIGGTTTATFLNDVFHSEVTYPDMELDSVPSLECGHTYYWRTRVRQVVTGEIIRSPWSETGNFVIKAGFKVTTPYYGPQLLSPANNCGCSCTAPINFSWSPYKETRGYWFELSQNSDMSNPMVHTLVNESTAYQYTGILKCNSTYYWRVMAQRPAPSEWSAVFTFKTQPQAEVTKTVLEAPVQVKLYIWFMIGVGTLLMVCLLVLIIQRRRGEE